MINILSKSCNFHDGCYPGRLPDRIAAGIKSDATRQQLLAENRLPLNKAGNFWGER